MLKIVPWLENGLFGKSSFKSIQLLTTESHPYNKIDIKRNSTVELFPYFSHDYFFGRGK